MRPDKLTLVLILVASPVLAQGPPIGVTVSVTRSTVTGGEAAHAGDAGTGFSAGVSMRQSITHWLRLEPELLATLRRAGTRGYEITCVGVSIVAPCNPIGWVRVRMITAQLPVLLRAELPAIGRSTVPFLTAGPAVSLRLGCSRRVDNGAGGEFRSNCESTNFSPLVDPVPGLPAIQSSEFQRWDVSLIGGLGIESNGVVVQARVERGLRQVEHSVPFPMSQMDGSKLLSLSFSVGVWLPEWRR